MSEPSGRFVLRIPPALHAALRAHSIRTGKSLNQICSERLGGFGTGGNLCPGSECWDISGLGAVASAWKSKLTGMVLFGSAARGEAWASSDVDLLMVLRRGIAAARGLYSDWDEFCAAERSAALDRISPHFVEYPAEISELGSLWFEVALEGILLWDPKLETAAILRGLRELMARGAVQRCSAQGQVYWVRRKEAA